MKGYKKNRPTAVSEFTIQRDIFKWAEYQAGKHPELHLLNASLNGVRTSIAQAGKAKAAGMKSGFPDLNLPVPRGAYHGLYIELKHESSTSQAQKDWLSALRGQGYCAEVCKGFQGTIGYIMWYLSLEQTRESIILDTASVSAQCLREDVLASGLYPRVAPERVLLHISTTKFALAKRLVEIGMNPYPDKEQKA